MSNIRGNVTINGEIPIAKKHFNKPSLNIEQQIQLLKDRWLIFWNEEKAKEYLNHISYYRLSWYTRIFYVDEEHNFQKGTNFKQIIDLYSFDRKLKNQLIDILERIEISFKTNMINTLSEEFWSHRFLDGKANHFTSPDASYNAFNLINQELEKNKDNIFIKHYYEAYSSPKYPPTRMLFQLLSFWKISNFYKCLSKTNQQKIAKKYGINFYVLSSWLDCLAYLRNLCAHADRVWNRKMTAKANIRNIEEFVPKDDENRPIIDKLYTYLLTILFLLKQISPESSRLEWFKKLLKSDNQIDKSKMWFPNDREKKIDEFLTFLNTPKKKIKHPLS